MWKFGAKAMHNLSTFKQSNTGKKRIILVFLALAAIFIAASTKPVKDPNKTFTLVLDAGHGGKDPGNLGTGNHKKTEKDISLDVVLELGKFIEEAYPDVEVVYTRSSDIFPTLKERVDIANKAKADLFISVHCNANDNKEAYGAETFVMGLHKSEESLKTAMRENASIFLEENHEADYQGFDPNNPDTYIAMSLRENIFLDHSLNLAKKVQDQFRTRVGRKDRGVKQAGYYVISFTNMPSVLIELGFLTNSTEENFLHSKEGKNYMSSAIFRAFKEFREKIETGQGKNIPQNQAINVPKDDKTVVTPNNNPTANNNTSKDAQGIIWREVPTGIKYQVQILTANKQVPKKSSELRGLTRVDEIAGNGVYKYFAGSTASYREAKANLQIVKDKGFKDAFIVAFENGKKIDLNQAIAKSNQ